MRFALYFLPRSGLLRELGSSWLGYDIVTGQAIHRPQTLLDLVPDIDTITAAPRRYGIHATLKAPFRLISEMMAADLRETLGSFCRDCPAFTVPGFALREIGDFFGMIPLANTDPLNRLAAELVRTFDRFRAPLSEPERQRRMAAGLTPSELAYLEQWGYPYVMKNFRFHISLTGPITDSGHRRSLLPILLEFLTPALCQTLQIDAVSLVRERDSKSRFEFLESFVLQG